MEHFSIFILKKVILLKLYNKLYIFRFSLNLNSYTQILSLPYLTLKKRDVPVNSH